MAKYAVGEFIYDVRKERGYTQEELAEGICTTGTLSKIENGSRVPSISTYEALMQRLGEPASLFSVYMGKKELEADNLCRKLLRMLARKECVDPKQLLEEYNIAIAKYSLNESQMMRCIKAVCHSFMKEPPQLVLNELYGALHRVAETTLDDWIKNPKKFLTFDEITIWNNIAIQYKRMGQMDLAYAIWQKLHDYLNEHVVDGEEKSKIYPVLVYNLAGICMEKKNYAEAVRYSEKGIRISVEYGRLFPLPYLLKQMGEGLRGLGNTYMSEEYIKQAEIILLVMKKNPNGTMEEMIAAF